MGDGEGTKQEQSWDSAPVVFHPTAPARAATCEHPEELKAPGVQSSPALLWSLHSSGQKEHRNSFHGGKSPAPCCYIKACFVGNASKDGVIWAAWIPWHSQVQDELQLLPFLQSLPLPFPSLFLPSPLPRFHVGKQHSNCSACFRDGNIRL